MHARRTTALARRRTPLTGPPAARASTSQVPLATAGPSRSVGRASRARRRSRRPPGQGRGSRVQRGTARRCGNRATAAAAGRRARGAQGARVCRRCRRRLRGRGAAPRRGRASTRTRRRLASRAPSAAGGRGSPPPALGAPGSRRNAKPRSDRCRRRRCSRWGASDLPHHERERLRFPPPRTKRWSRHARRLTTEYRARGWAAWGRTPTRAGASPTAWP
mmetsp:Transcript_30582/g.94478  ORF Transcript_30582/g.94478 Transcript_30582/m.94478 type:complete len:219 (-) Transcript_30582:852-1508(-)